MSTENNLINIFVQKLNSILDNPCLVNIIIKRIDELVTNDYYNKNLHKNCKTEDDFKKMLELYYNATSNDSLDYSIKKMLTIYFVLKNKNTCIDTLENHYRNNIQTYYSYELFIRDLRDILTQKQDPSFETNFLKRFQDRSETLNIVYENLIKPIINEKDLRNIIVERKLEIYRITNY